MRHLAVASAVFLASTLTAAPAPAGVPPDQARSVLASAASEWLPGDRLRIVSKEPYRTALTARYSSLEGDSIVRVSASGNESPMPIHLRQIGSIEQPSGTKRHVMTGAIVGLAIGSIVGYALARNTEEIEFTIPELRTTVRSKGLRSTVFAIGSASGLVLGATAGFLIRTDRWGVVARFD